MGPASHYRQLCAKGPCSVAKGKSLLAEHVQHSRAPIGSKRPCEKASSHIKKAIIGVVGSGFF